VDPRTGLDDAEKRKFLALPGLERRPLGHPACSQSLYRLPYPGSIIIIIIITRCGPPALGLGVGLRAPHRKENKLVTKCHKGPRTWTNSLDLTQVRDQWRRALVNTVMNLRVP
jgi:hypothetical protein